MWPIFQKALYDARRTIFWLSIGMIAYGLMIGAFFPAVAQEADKLAEFYQSLPDSVLGLFGGSMNMADPIIWINLEFLLWAILILGAVVMVQAFNAVTNAERSGTMDVVMAFPVSRRDMLIARYLNTLVTLVVVLTTIFLILVIDTLIWTELDVTVGQLFVMVYGALFILVPYATFTYALTTLIPSSKRWAGAIAYTIFFGMYFIHGMSSANADLAEVIQPFMLFDYYNGPDLAHNGVEIGKALLMVAVTALFAGLAWWRIDEKELGV